MMASRSEVWLTPPSQADLDWLIAQEVWPAAMVQPTPIMIATGTMAADGKLEHAEEGERWLAFEEAEDYVFWQPRRGVIATFANRAFALGEAAIDNAGTCAFDCCLNIFDGPLDWLRAHRDGIVVPPEKWPLAFDRLRDVPRIAVSEHLLRTYQRQMRPSRLPELHVLPERARAA